MVIVFALAIVNGIVGDAAEETLIQIAEQNAIRDAFFIQSMVLSARPAQDSLGSASSREPGRERPEGAELLANIERLSSTYPALVRAFDVVSVTLFDSQGYVVWSSAPETFRPERKGVAFWAAMRGEITSKFVRSKEIKALDGKSRPLDVVETYLPLRASPSSEIVGVLALHKDAGSEVAGPTVNTKTALLMTTLATMTGLFLVLSVFIMVADVTIYRSRKREVALIETQLTERRRAEEEMRDLANFPGEDPSPVLRVARGGTVLYANDAALPLLVNRGSGVGLPLPDQWLQSIELPASPGSNEEIELEQGGRTFSFVVAPLADAGYVNLYGRDNQPKEAVGGGTQGLYGGAAAQQP